jgi:hypothetical protein
LFPFPTPPWWTYGYINYGCIQNICSKQKWERWTLLKVFCDSGQYCYHIMIRHPVIILLVFTAAIIRYSPPLHWVKATLVARPLLTPVAQKLCRWEHGVFTSRTCVHSRTLLSIEIDCWCLWRIY